MIESYDATLADLKRQRDELDRLIKGLTKFRASSAVKTDSSAVETNKTAMRWKRNGTRASQVCTAAEAFLREGGTPRSTSAILGGIRNAGIEIDQGALSSYLSKSRKFYSQNREWHLVDWQNAAVPAADDTVSPPDP